MKNRILIKNLEFKCIIGILPFERLNKQKVLINLSFTYRYKKEKYFIDYNDIINLLQNIMKRKKFLLLEDAIVYIQKRVFKIYKIRKLKIKISKPEVYNNCIVSLSNKMK